MTEENVYAPPAANLAVAAENDLAGRWERLGAALIDKPEWRCTLGQACLNTPNQLDTCGQTARCALSPGNAPILLKRDLIT